MATKYPIKQGATGPPLVGRVRDKKGFVAIAGATVTIRWQSIATPGTVFEAVCTNLDDNTSARKGKFTYDWQPGDTDVADLNRLEIEVVYLDGTVEFFPDDGFDLLEVVPTLGA